MQRGLAGSPAAFCANAAIALQRLTKGSNGDAITRPCTGCVDVSAIHADVNAAARNDNIVLTGWRNESVASEFQLFEFWSLGNVGAKASIESGRSESR